MMRIGAAVREPCAAISAAPASTNATTWLFSIHMRKSRCREGAKPQHRVPVASRAAHAELLFDERSGQTGPPHAVRVHDVRVSSICVDDFAPGNGGAQRLDVPGLRRILEEHDDEPRRIAL